MKIRMSVLLLGAILFASCSFKDDDQAGVTITGNTGKISGIVLQENPASLSKAGRFAQSAADSVSVVLSSTTQEFIPETLWVEMQKFFLFDSLPEGDYQIVASVGNEERAQIAGISLNAGEEVRVTLYTGEKAPDSKWELLQFGVLKMQAPTMGDAKLYLLPALSEEVGVIDVPANGQIALELPEGDYRAVVYSMEYTSTEFVSIQVQSGKESVVEFKHWDKLEERNRISAAELPGLTTAMGVQGDIVRWSGLQWMGYLAPSAKVRMLRTTPIDAVCMYNTDTLKVSEVQRHGDLFLVDSNGRGVWFRGQTDGPVQVNIPLLHPEGFAWDIDDKRTYTILDLQDAWEMDHGSAMVPVDLQMTVLYDSEPILTVDNEALRFWNNLDVLYVFNSPMVAFPGLPNHAGLWLNYVWFGYNRDGDPWFVQSVSDSELRLVDYPHTGDTLAGIRLDSLARQDQFLPENFKGIRQYRNDSVSISLQVTAPYLQSNFASE